MNLAALRMVSSPQEGLVFLLLCLLLGGCGTDRAKRSTPTSGAATGRAVTLRVTVPPAFISPRVAESLSDSLTLKPGEKADPERIPRYFQVHALMGRQPERAIGTEKQFDPASGTAMVEVDRGNKNQRHGLYMVAFKGARWPLRALLPAFWWNVPPEGVAVNPQSTLWAEVAQEMIRQKTAPVPHAQVWELLQKSPLDAGEVGSEPFNRRRRQLVNWLNTAMGRFRGKKLPPGGRVYGPLCALSVTPLEGDPNGRLAAKAMAGYHKALDALAVRVMSSQPNQGKSMVRSKKVTAFVGELNSAPATAAEFSKQLKALEKLYAQAGPWPFDEKPKGHEFALLSFEKGRIPRRLPPAKAPEPPAVPTAPLPPGQGQPPGAYYSPSAPGQWNPYSPSVEPETELF